MKIKRTLLSAMLVMGCTALSAQEQPKTEYVFNPHWYGQVQIGGQYTLGEVGFGDLLSPNIQIGAGYNFDKVLGARFSIGAWQSKGGLKMESLGVEETWNWKYIAPQVDLTFNLSNLICGYNPERPVQIGAFVGLGLNIAFSNDDANDLRKVLGEEHGTQNLAYCWDGTKARLAGRFGLTGDYRIDDQWSVGLELQANFIGDHYNSKRAGNADWYFNGLVGVKYNLGSTHSKRNVVSEATAARAERDKYQDRINALERRVDELSKRPVQVVQPAAQEKAEPLRRDVFFTINSTGITADEMVKVKEIADYLKKYPKATVKVTGYADKGTGNAKINKRISVRRAQAVVDALTQKYGISSSRITSAGLGDTEQPFSKAILNRVSICIAE